MAAARFLLLFAQIDDHVANAMEEQTSHPVVLLADDDPESAESWTAVLRSNGWNVVLAPDGATALLLARQATPDLLITDLNMPNMDGLSLCLAFRADPALATVPIILASGDPLPGDAITTSHDFFLQKPVGPMALVAAIAALAMPKKP
jgi:CheY-like chemotaxis protein